MSRFGTFFAAFIMLITLAGCGPMTKHPESTHAEIEDEESKQEGMALDQMMAEEEVVKDIGYTIIDANAPLCKKTAWSIGAQFWNKYSLGRKYRDAAETQYGLDTRLRIKHVYDGSPAQESGLQPGDILVAVGDSKIPKGDRGFKKLQKILDDAAPPDIAVTIERDGQEITKTIHARKICDYNFIYESQNADINAYADGGNITITRGMLRFVNTEQEMAHVMTHELAHNVMLHNQKTEANMAIGQLGGFLIDMMSAHEGIDTDGKYEGLGMGIGARAYSVAFEQEADYVGMYFLERAGYDLQGSEEFERRVAVEDSTIAMKETTHPGSPERYLAMAKTREEIERKKAAGLPLIPEFSEIDFKDTYLNIPAGGV